MKCRHLLPAPVASFSRGRLSCRSTSGTPTSQSRGNVLDRRLDVYQGDVVVLEACLVVNVVVDLDVLETGILINVVVLDRVVLVLVLLKVLKGQLEIGRHNISSFPGDDLFGLPRLSLVDHHIGALFAYVEVTQKAVVPVTVTRPRCIKGLVGLFL